MQRRLQAKHLYPQIAARDAEEEITAGFLRSLNDKNYGFSTWEALPVHNVGKKKQPKQVGRNQGAAALVGSQVCPLLAAHSNPTPCLSAERWASV